MKAQTFKGRKIVVGMSGGVDSSMSLLLLKKQGWQPIGVSLKLPVWQDKANLLRENICCTTQSLGIAKRICQELNVPYHIIDVRPEFKKQVIDYFVKELKNHRTPNPCIVCNQRLKFKELFRFAKKIGASHVATGHYARVRENKKTGLAELLVAKDKNKDQTYSLSFLPQKWLKKIVFPLGGYTKEKIYKLAKKEGFEFFLKKQESQDFCFVAGKSLGAFLKGRFGEKLGEVVDEQGRVLGRHRGLHFFTIGQRKGLGFSGGPYYVKEFDVSKNRLLVTKDPQKNTQKEIILSPFHLTSGQPLKKKRKVKVKTRYHQPLVEATLVPLSKGKLKLVLKKGLAMVTPGQFAVFYHGNICLGGGRIRLNEKVQIHMGQ